MTEDMQLLVRVYRPEEARMIAEMLQNNGIPALLQGEHFSGLYPVFPTRVGEIRILVAQAQLPDASELLRAYFGKEIDGPAGL